MEFIVQAFSVDSDSRNENGHSNSARDAEGRDSSAFGPHVTGSACKCRTLTPSMGPVFNQMSLINEL